MQPPTGKRRLVPIWLTMDLLVAWDSRVCSDMIARTFWTLVHGDDYFSCGPPDSLDWLEKTLTQQYEIKTTRVGHGQKASKGGQILNRVVRATDKGYEMEADPRHAELIIEQLDLTNAKGVSSPGTDEPSADIEEEPEPLETEQASAFRAIAASCNYLAADRPDIMYAVKELCREMSNPNSRSMARLKRVGRYLVAKPRQIWRYDWQAPVYTVDINTDANWCGCKVGRKSTSGGTILRGGHLVKAWSKTQAVIAKSSAESELYAIVKGSCEGLGVCTLLKDFGETQPQARIHIDAFAAKGIVERRGLGKLRHIEVDVLWLQEQYARRLVPLHKCLDTDNVADMLTKHIAAPTIRHYSDALAIDYPEGRSSIAQKLHSMGLAIEY